MATDAVRIDLIQFGRKTGMFTVALQRKDIDARHQSVPGGMAFRAIDLRMQGRLLPKRRLSLLIMAGNAEFLFSGCIGRECNSRIEH